MSDKDRHPLLSNAISSIVMGIEDYNEENEVRNLSSVRNVLAGILLLYKYKLILLSPKNDEDLLIKKNLLPVLDNNNQVTFKGARNTTIGVQEIKDRFKSLKICIDEPRLNKINKLRTDIEHYYTPKSPEVVREIISESFLLVRDFLVKHLQLDPIEELGNDAWSSFLDINDIYMAEKEKCDSSIDNCSWNISIIPNLIKKGSCPNCSSSLLYIEGSPIPFDTDLKCTACGSQFTFEEIAEECVESYLGGKAHYSIKTGGNSPYTTCHNCHQETFILEEECCIACGAQLDYEDCKRCQRTLNIDEQDLGGYCSDCYYQYQKMLDE